uniref:Uncharacterized protein n=1 Tax=Oryza punctata TaxID=4537 RepID=A0A0E0L4Y1_ORYPU
MQHIGEPPDPTRTSPDLASPLFVGSAPATLSPCKPDTPTSMVTMTIVCMTTVEEKRHDTSHYVDMSCFSDNNPITLPLFDFWLFPFISDLVPKYQTSLAWGAYCLAKAFNHTQPKPNMS